MAHYAKIENDLVTEVIVAEQDHIDTLDGEWVQTSYNTYGNVHKFGNIPLRKNFAGIGSTYNRELDAFIAPKPHASWSLNEETGLWQAPIPEPKTDFKHFWNEEDQVWVESVYPAGE
jgi:hypothetical protein